MEASGIGLGPVLTGEKLAGLILAAVPKKMKGCQYLDISRNDIRKVSWAVLFFLGGPLQCALPLAILLGVWSMSSAWLRLWTYFCPEKGSMGVTCRLCL